MSLRPTEEHLKFNETAYETVKVYGVLGISITTDDGLQHRAVDVETCKVKTGNFYFYIVVKKNRCPVLAGRYVTQPPMFCSCEHALIVSQGLGVPKLAFPVCL